MQHPLEPLSRLLRLGFITDTSVEIVNRPPNLLESVRDRGWLQGLQPASKEELVPFVTQRIVWAERFLHRGLRSQKSPVAKVVLRDHFRAAVYKCVSILATMPFTAVYVSAATHTARHSQVSL